MCCSMVAISRFLVSAFSMQIFSLAHHSVSVDVYVEVGSIEPVELVVLVLFARVVDDVATAVKMEVVKEVELAELGIPVVACRRAGGCAEW